MSSFFDDPALYRSLLENLPIGIYVLDRDQRVRFWNRGAEQITGYLAHEVMGHICREPIPHCDLQGCVLSGEQCAVTTTLRGGAAQQQHVFTLHKQGHRLGVHVRTLPLFDDKDVITGVAVAFEEALANSTAESTAAPISGRLDPLTGVPSQRFTRAVLSESIVALQETHGGVGVLRIRILGLKEFSAKYGADSVAPFLRTSAQTIRHSLSSEDFLGRWVDDEFLAILQTVSPSKIEAVAELIYRQVNQSEVLWWGDRFRIQAAVDSVVAREGDTLETLLNKMKPTHVRQSAEAAGVDGSTGSATTRG